MTDSVLRFMDELGPEKVVHIYNPQHRLKAVLVIDNVAIGPSIGGIRMAPDVTEKEAFRLARAMTLKNAAAGLPHGGGKSVIQADPKSISESEKEILIRSFAQAIRELKDYIPGPDMGTDETCMAWIKDEINRSVGLPATIGGIPLDEIGATAWGLLASANTACEMYQIPLAGARASIQGFGAVGKHAARFFQNSGARIVAVSDSGGTAYRPDGLDVPELLKLKSEGQSVVSYEGAETGDTDMIVSLPSDIWIPAARPDIINTENVASLDTQLILQGANIPITEEAEEILFEKGIHNIPDFIANAGGVICASVEYHGGTEKQALDVIAQKIETNTRHVIRKSLDEKISPRRAAHALALERVQEAMQFRRI